MVGNSNNAENHIMSDGDSRLHCREYPCTSQTGPVFDSLLPNALIPAGYDLVSSGGAARVWGDSRGFARRECSVLVSVIGRRRIGVRWR
jgi:hypothetical protein